MSPATFPTPGSSICVFGRFRPIRPRAGIGVKFVATGAIQSRTRRKRIQGGFAEMSKDAIRRGFAIGAVLALAAAPAAFAVKPADPGSNGHGHGKGHEAGHSKAGGKAVVMYVFKGTYSDSGSVVVDHGNAHVRKANLIGTTVSFNLTGAKIVVDDNNADGNRDLTDVHNGDQVVVKARLPRTDPGAQPYTAKQLVDQTHTPPTP
jgi:hypothetical protein